MNLTYEILHSETLTLAVELANCDYFTFGTLTRNIQSDGRTVYVFDVDPDKYYKALELANTEILIGFNPDNGWIQRHDKEIALLYERTYHPKRSDLDELLEPYGMTKQTYSKWELLKRTKAWSSSSKIRVLP